MEKQDLKDLVTFIDQSTIREFQLETNHYKLYINKNEVSGIEKTTQPIENEQVATTAPDKQPAEDSVTETQLETSLGELITSPLVGIAYSSSSPTQAPFKKVGDSVEIGETVCIVESMKIMNDIPSQVTGIITKVLFKNEEVVEYGQPLFEVEKNNKN